jgi:hypothetical protein
MCNLSTGNILELDDGDKKNSISVIFVRFLVRVFIIIFHIAQIVDHFKMSSSFYIILYLY